MINKLHSEMVKLGNRNISYLTGGDGDPLVVIHGGGNSSRSWMQNARELSNHYHIYVPDLPGFGHTQPKKNGDFSLNECVAFIERFSSGLGLQRFHLVGHSLGGSIAIRYALDKPSKVKKLVLVSSLCLGKEIALWARFMVWITCPAAKVILFIINTIGKLARLVHFPFRFKNLLPQVNLSMGKNIMTLKGQTNVLLDHLNELLVPTMLIWGNKDGIVPVNHAYAAAQLIPDCRLHIFRDCGHSVYRQKIQEFSRLLVDFLD